jgi:hypothetical protein
MGMFKVIYNIFGLGHEFLQFWGKGCGPMLHTHKEITRYETSLVHDGTRGIWLHRTVPKTADDNLHFFAQWALA